MRRIGLLLCVCLLAAPACGRLGKRSRAAQDVALPDLEAGAGTAAAEDVPAVEQLQEAQKRSNELEKRLDESTRQIEQLQRELEASRRQKGGTRAADGAAAPELWGHTPAALPPGVADDQPAEIESPQTVIASLRQALGRESQRRESLEKELARLKQETSSPVFGDSRVSEADFLAVKQELVELRRTLDQERHTREQLAEQLRSLQSERARPVAGSGGAETAEMRVRLRKLEDDKRKILESLDRSVATSQRRAAELERRLRTLHSSDGRGGDSLGAIQAENAALRASLDEERKRTELLAAKLKAATKITDLINDIGDAPE